MWRHNRRAGGFSLVELLIVILIGAIIAAAMAGLFAQSSKTREQINRTSERIENGRFALDAMAEDIRLAGFFGDLSPPSNTTWSASGWGTTENPCAASIADLGQHWDSASAKLPSPILGYETHGLTAVSLPCLANFKPGSVSTNMGSDVLVIRRVSTVAVAPSALSGTGTAALQVSTQTPFCASKDASSFVVSDTATSLNLHRTDCTSTAFARPIVVRIYYVASCNICSGSGTDTVPTLKVAELVNGAFVARSIAPGIDQIHFEYGVDTTGDGSTEEYRLATNDGLVDSRQWSDVMSVKLYVLARELQENRDFTDTQAHVLGTKTVTAYNDHYKRHGLSTTVRLTNVSGRREVP